MIRNKGIGDDVMALPALRQLRAHMPHAQMDLLIRPCNSTLFTDEGLFDRILIYERSCRTRVRGERQYDTRTMLRQIRVEKYDAAICLISQEIALRLPFYGHVPVIVGNKTHDDRYDFLMTHILDSPWMEDVLMSPVDACLDFVRQLGVPLQSTVPYGFCVPEESRSKVAAMRIAEAENRPYAVIHPCSSNPNKSWAPERFAIVADHLVSRYNLDVIVSGSASDIDVAGRVIAGATHRTRMRNFAGMLSLPDAAALYETAAIMVTVDSGPMHLADAVGTPLVALFLPWNRNCRPYRQPGAVVLPEDPVFSSLLDSPGDTEWVNYMLRITVERVIQAVDDRASRLGLAALGPVYNQG